MVHPDDLVRVGEEVKAHSIQGTVHFHQEYRIITKAGLELRVEREFYRLLRDDKQVTTRGGGS